jgi:hypothetical protein
MTQLSPLYWTGCGRRRRGLYCRRSPPSAAGPPHSWAAGHVCSSCQQAPHPPHPHCWQDSRQEDGPHGCSPAERPQLLQEEFCLCCHWQPAAAGDRLGLPPPSLRLQFPLDRSAIRPLYQLANFRWGDAPDDSESADLFAELLISTPPPLGQTTALPISTCLIMTLQRRDLFQYLGAFCADRHLPTAAEPVSLPVMTSQICLLLKPLPWFSFPQRP